MNKWLLLPVLIGAAVCPVTGAPPLLTAPTPRMQWTMLLVPPPGDSLAAVRWDFQKAVDLTQVEVTFAQGARRSYWQTQGHTLSEKKNGKIHVQQDHPMGPESYPRAAEGFYGISRINPAHEQEARDFEGTPCRYFHGKTPATEGDGPAGERDYEAWFDAATGLPKAYRQDGLTFVFSFSPTPPPRLELPARWRAAWSQYQENRRKSGLGNHPGQIEFAP